jgi:hypothetical protein
MVATPKVCGTYYQPTGRSVDAEQVLSTLRTKIERDARLEVAMSDPCWASPLSP